MTFDAYAYAIHTRRVTLDGETYFKASVAELPHLATYENTAQEAYEVLIEDIKALHEAAVRLGHEFPAPIEEPSKEHSGRITLRLPRTLHRKLVEQCVYEDTSLNLYIVSLLSQGVSTANVASEVAASIKSIAKSAITAAALLRSEEVPATKPAISYSRTAQIKLPEKDEKWILQ